MTNKRVVKYPVEDKIHQVQTYIPVGIVEGKKPGPTLAVIGGVHASEYAAQDGVQRFFSSLSPENLQGKVLAVLAADVIAMCAHHIYTNPIDGNNLNRIWPGKPDGTITEVIAHTLMEKVITKADAIVDCHGGEFDEYMADYMITSFGGDKEVDRKTLQLALAVGLPFIEITDAHGEWLGTGTLDGEAIKRGVSSVGLEIGHRGFRDERSISTVVQALTNAARHLDMLPGDPVPLGGRPALLKEGIILKTEKQGLYEPAVRIGDWIDKGAVFARVFDFDGTLLEEIFSPDDGTVLTVISARAIAAGGFAGKVGVIDETESAKAILEEGK